MVDWSGATENLVGDMTNVTVNDTVSTEGTSSRFHDALSRESWFSTA